MYREALVREGPEAPPDVPGPPILTWRPERDEDRRRHRAKDRDRPFHRDAHAPCAPRENDERPVRIRRPGRPHTDLDHDPQRHPNLTRRRRRKIRGVSFPSDDGRNDRRHQ